MPKKKPTTKKKTATSPTVSNATSSRAGKRTLLSDYNKWLPILLIVGGLLAFVLSGWLWWEKVYQSPSRVFWGMFDSAMNTRSVTRHTIQDTGAAKLDQKIRLGFGGENYAYGMTTITQQSPEGEQRVVTETIGLPKMDFARYKEIDPGQSGSDGNRLDFSSITGIWGKSESEEMKQDGYFSEAFLGIVPFASMQQSDRAYIVNMMKDRDVYHTDLSQMERTFDNGKRVYKYKVAIKPQAYVQMLQEFLRRSGFGELSGLDPQNYADAADVELSLFIDPVSRQLVKITYDSGIREERYGDYGIQSKLQIPQETISMEELQSRLQAIQTPGN